MPNSSKQKTKLVAKVRKAQKAAQKNVDKLKLVKPLYTQLPEPKQHKTDEQLIWMFSHGIEEGHYTSVVMQSPNYVVFKIAGHKAWACVACPFQYVKAQYVLIRKGDWLMSDKPQRRWEGRVAKAMLKEALRRSEILKTAYTGDFQAPICEECDCEMNYGQGEVRGVLVEYYSCDECGWSVDV